MGGILVFFYIFFIGKGLILIDSVYYSFGLSRDIISFSLVILSLWVVMVMYYRRNGVRGRLNEGYFFGFVYFLGLILLFTFLSRNLFSFYFFFECSLIPTLLIILG